MITLVSIYMYPSDLIKLPPSQLYDSLYANEATLTTMGEYILLDHNIVNITTAKRITTKPWAYFSSIRRTKFKNLKVSRFVLHLSLPNQLKPDVKSGMKM